MEDPIVKKDIDTIITALKKEFKMLEGKTVLVTGSAGFFGNYFVAVLNELNAGILKKPCNIIAIDNYITGTKKGIINQTGLKNFTFINQDISKPVNLPGPIDYIIDAAGIASPFFYMQFPLETIEVSTTGTKNMLELARKKKTKSMIFFSSSEIYGDPPNEHIPTKETYRGHVSSVGPRSCYDESKRLGETLCMAYFKLFKAPVKIVRPFNVYGPGMRPDDRRVLSTFLTFVLEHKTLPIHGNGMQTRTYSYISDAITGFFQVLLKGTDGGIYNIGNDKNETNLVNLAKTIARVFAGKVKIKKIPYPKNYPGDEANRRCPDISKAESELGFKNHVNLEQGLERTLSWYKSMFYNK